jgi:hypothetical protein
MTAKSLRYKVVNWALLVCLAFIGFGAALCAPFDHWLNPKDEKNTTTTVTVSPKQYTYPQDEQERGSRWKFWPL